jgi:hypothetical protein
LMKMAWTLIGPDRKPYPSDRPGTLGGHRRSRIYGRLDCPAALRAIARGGYITQRVFFLTEDHARIAGYRPCGVCLPAAYACWKAEQGDFMEKILKQLEKAWTEFKESYAGLTDSQLTEPGVTGAWSVKDIIAHVTWWEEEALKHLPLIIKGGRPPRYSTKYGGIDAFNARMTEQKQGLSLSEVLRQMDETHRRLVGYVMSVSEEQFTRETRARRRLRLDTYSHYPKHARAIREWRDRSGRAKSEVATQSAND